METKVILCGKRQKKALRLLLHKTYACLLAQFFVYLDTGANLLARVSARLFHQNANHFGL